MIAFEGVRVTVPAARRGEPERVLLDGLSLELGERRVAVIGANGSGKSTLLRLVNGLRRPTSGTVRVEGVDVAAEPGRVRAMVGFIFTDPLAQLLMSTPIEDVELSLKAAGAPRRDRNAGARRLLDEAGLAHLAHQSVYDLSGGERQLVALTSVLAVAPRIIVADEPTTLLDLRNRQALRRRLAGLPQQLVYSTHDMDLARDADRVLVVDAGRIVADGAPEECIGFYAGAMGVAP